MNTLDLPIKCDHVFQCRNISVFMEEHHDAPAYDTLRHNNQFFLPKIFSKFVDNLRTVIDGDQVFNSGLNGLTVEIQFNFEHIDSIQNSIIEHIRNTITHITEHMGIVISVYIISDYVYLHIEHLNEEIYRAVQSMIKRMKLLNDIEKYQLGILPSDVKNVASYKKVTLTVNDRLALLFMK